MTAGAGSPTESGDSVAGTGLQSGGGAIAEGHDTVAGSGAQSKAGSGAIAEGHDTVAGAGIGPRVGGGAIAEGADTAAGAGALLTGGAGIAEPHDTTSGTASQSLGGSGAFREPGESMGGPGGGESFSGWGVGTPVYTFPPDWSEDWAPPVAEILTWRTDVMRAAVTGTSFHNSQRIAPARAFQFNVVDSGQFWRVQDQVLDSLGGRVFMLPIWQDVQQLATPVTAGDTTITCLTDGMDFAAPGGFALLWTSPIVWTVVQIASIASGVLTLQGNIPVSVAAGSRIYPLRKARLADGGQETIWGGNDKGVRSLHFDIYEPCDWPAATLTTYQTHPVLEWHGNDGSDPTRSFNRVMGYIDNGLSDPEIFDLAGSSFRGSQFTVMLFGRQEHTDFRGLLYALRGASSPIWVPSFKADFNVLNTIASTDTTITVEWSGYTVMGARSPNRKDIRIELNDGTVLYRRITGSVESSGNEVLTIDTSLGVTVAISAIRFVSFMVLSICADSVQIDHVTDAAGTATCQLTFSAVVPDV